MSVDFNANNYDISELVAILKFEHRPINKSIIDRRILELKRKFKGQEKYESFFEDAKTLLIENVAHFNKETWYEGIKTSDGDNEFHQQFQDKKEETEEKI